MADFTKFWQNNFEFREIWGKFSKTQNLKFHEITKTKILQPPYVGVEWGGGAGRYSPGAPSSVTQIVHYSSYNYTDFHSVIYNSVLKIQKI